MHPFRKSARRAHSNGLRSVFLIALAAVASACSTPAPKLTDLLNGRLKESYSETQAVEVFYATNRQSLSQAPDCSDRAFGVAFEEVSRYGACQINVPKLRPVGTFEMASNPRADSHRYFRAFAHAPFPSSGELESSLKETLKRRGSTEVLVFIHGFNVKYEESIVRAAQIAYDVKFQGPVIVYSWPAGSDGGLLSGALINRTYEQNRKAAAASVPKLVELFKTLAGLGATPHVIVHSMGHQLALPALAQLADEGTSPFLGELVLNAPDIDLGLFTGLAAKVRKLARRVTVYCSFNDNAIAASETFNGGRRLGACERVADVDMVNVSEVDAPGVSGLGHSYYAGRAILTELFQVLLGIDAEKRLFIRKSEPNSTENFYLRP
ncbi:MAG: alpha/beta hydrolase [Oligoflexia bacterium]|nr:alpha/beta hydrolase [Oligoflexia bacterium]